MKLYVAPRTPNCRRVEMFLAEKGIDGLEREAVDINAGAHRRAEFTVVNPLSRVPVLRLDDGRHLAESRAICTWLEQWRPEPNLMGRDGEERAFIEMTDRQVEFYLFVPIGQAVRHTHPGLLVLESPQFPDFGRSQGERVLEYARIFDAQLATRPWFAGDRFTIADITAFCAVEFARLIRFKPADHGLSHLAEWRERVAARPSAAM